MNESDKPTRYRVIRGAYKPRGVVWEELETGSTNRLWRGRSHHGDWLFKRYRYPQAGIHPEVEVAEYLQKYPDIGVAEFGGKVEEKVGEEWITVGLIQRWVNGRVAWERILEDLSLGKRSVALAKRWGQTVGELHQALSAGESGSGFSKELWSENDQSNWAARVEEIGEQLQGALFGAEPVGVAAEVWEKLKRGWVEGADVWKERARGLRGLSLTGWKSRVHGDLHLGQILETEEERAIIVDFEGEPMRPLAERRGKDLPLRDVAGMLRSFVYAGEVSGVGANGVVELQEAFLEGWCEEMTLPAGDWRAVLDGLVWEKAIYEAVYELRHRPTWLGVPVAALLK